MIVTIDGVKYESVDTPITEGMDISCKECDIFKARIPKSLIDVPLCYERTNGIIKQSCYAKAKMGIKRNFKRMEE